MHYVHDYLLFIILQAFNIQFETVWINECSNMILRSLCLFIPGREIKLDIPRSSERDGDMQDPVTNPEKLRTRIMFYFHYEQCCTTFTAFDWLWFIIHAP